ncbi:MAG TPA: CapA family protein [Treponemataceae bacterium]|nr:CapA family protein [Treponemataceae bacterium]
MKSRFCLFTIFLSFIVFSTCTTIKSSQEISSDVLPITEEQQTIKDDPDEDVLVKEIEPEKIESEEIELEGLGSLLLTFAGDIMAHNVNFNMSDYSLIYQNVSNLLLSDDLTFGNLETPVTDSLPLSTYPNFNVHSNYPLAAVHAGFDVFALANNHSNDQGIEGIDGTLSVMNNLSPLVYSSGLKKNAEDPFKPVIIEKKGWKIAFLSVTEIFNAHDSASKRVYYVSPTQAARTDFLATISQIKATYQCDIFILALHSNEPEYVLKESKQKRIWFSQLCAAGVDIVWAHHPHVMQPWETLSIVDQITRQEKEALIMYSMGNFISGQRYTPNTENPAAIREYTGDSVLLQVTLNKKKPELSATMNLEPFLITNYSERGLGVTVHHLNESYISSQKGIWKEYYQSRFNLMHEYLPLLPMKQGTAILE